MLTLRQIPVHQLFDIENLVFFKKLELNIDRNLNISTLTLQNHHTCASSMSVKLISMLIATS